MSSLECPGGWATLAEALHFAEEKHSHWKPQVGKTFFPANSDWLRFPRWESIKFVEVEPDFHGAMSHLSTAIIRWDSKRLVLALVDRGEDVDALTCDGFSRSKKTLLRMAIERHRVESVRALLKRGATVNLVDELGFTGHDMAQDMIRMSDRFVVWSEIKIFTMVRRAKLCQEFLPLALCANRLFGGKKSRTCPRVILQVIANFLCQAKFDHVIANFVDVAGMTYFL